MKLFITLFKDGMSRGDEISGSSIFDFFFILFASIFILVSLFFIISDKFSNKNDIKKSDDVVIKNKINVEKDKYSNKTKEEMISEIYNYMIKKPNRKEFGYYSGATERYNKAVDSAQKSLIQKDKVISNLNAKNISELKTYLGFFENETIDFSKMFKNT